MAIFRRRRKDNPFERRGQWFKGALHVRLGAPADASALSKLAGAYARRHFAFAFVTDGQVPRQAEGLDHGVLILPGFEASVRSDDPFREYRFIGLGSSQGPEEDLTSPAELLKAVRDAAPFCMLAHPYLSGLSAREIAALEGLDALEVYNRRADTLGRGSSEYTLDWCLGAGRRLHVAAVDDLDDLTDAGRAWVMVRAKSCKPKRIVDALREGMFYSSCGPEIYDLRVRDEGIQVRTSPCRRILFVADDLKGKRFTAPPGEALTAAEYRFRGGESVIRIECIDAEGRKAWSNPLYF